MVTTNWKTIECGNAPTPRHENGFVQLKGKFYLLGGRGIKPVEEFDPTTNSWRKLSPPPIEIHHFQPVVIGEYIYLIGAMTGEFPYETPLANIYLYHVESDTWEVGPEIPQHRRRGSAATVVFQNKVYLAGGIIDGHNSGCVAWLDEYDPETNTWTELTDAPHVRDHFPAIVVQNKLYCVGGRDTSVHTENDYNAFFAAVIPQVDVYDFDSNSWITLSENLPVGTAAGSIALYENHILYFGGESGEPIAHNHTQAFDLDSKTWSISGYLERGRHGTQAATLNKKIYIASGSGNQGGNPELPSIEVL